jgi:hypothetical protein
MARKVIINGQIYEETDTRKVIVNGRIFDATVSVGGVVITDVNTTESWTDGDTNLVITGTGFV